MKELIVPECATCQDNCCLVGGYKLTNADIERIESLGHKRKHFCFPAEYGMIQMKRPCPFFHHDMGRCGIYPYRPYGCRVGPLAIMQETWVCTTHPDCPARGTISRETIRDYCPSLRNYLKTIIEEGKARMELRDSHIKTWDDLWEQKGGLKI